MKLKTSELTGAALDWAVAKCEGKNGVLHDDGITRCIMLENAKGLYAGRFNPSTDWSQGGPIIEREGIELVCNLRPDEARTFKTTPHWRASRRAWSKGDIWYGPTPLIAAMRCFVSSRLGDKVDIPEDFLKERRHALS